MEGDAKPWSVLTYALLHGSWTHLLLNSIWLLAFGSAVARRFGSVRFVAFMALTAIGGALGHLLTHTEDVVPMIGASAAVSGCMAAALRIRFQAGAPLGGFSIGGIEAYRLPALGLRDIFRERRAMMFLMVWLVMNILTGIGAPEFGLADAAVAWEAHIGGFVVAGVLPALRPKSLPALAIGRRLRPACMTQLRAPSRHVETGWRKKMIPKHER